MNKKKKPVKELISDFSDEITSFLCKKQANVFDKFRLYDEIEQGKITKLIDSIERSKDDIRRIKNYFS